MHDKQVRRRRAVLVLLVGVSVVLLTAYFREASTSPLHTVQRGVVTIDEMARLSQLAAPLQDIYERATPEFGGQAASP